MGITRNSLKEKILSKSLSAKEKGEVFEKLLDKHKLLARSMANDFIKSHFIMGHISEEDLSDRSKFLERVKALFRAGHFRAVFDYRGMILEVAEKFWNEGLYAFSVTFYAMYFEHSINSIIAHALGKQKISYKTKDRLLRIFKLEDKFTCLLELLGLPQFNYDYYKFIRCLAEERNVFVHYKFNHRLDKVQSDREFLIKGIKLTLRYMRQYETRVTFLKKKAQFERSLRKMKGK